jgi:hypothetical protein
LRRPDGLFDMVERGLGIPERELAARKVIVLQIDEE